MADYIREECKGVDNKDVIYRYRLKKLDEYLALHDLEINQIHYKQAQAYQGWLLDQVSGTGKKYGKGTVCNFIKTAQSFYDYLVSRDMVFNNPFKQIRKVHPVKKVPDNILKEKQTFLLLQKLSEFDRVEGDLTKMVRRYKTHVICELLYATGLRITEAACLKQDDIDLNKRSVTLKRSKNGRDHMVFLHDYAADVLSFYMNHMRDLILCKNCNPDLFFGARGTRLDMVVNEELKQVCRELNLPRITCHGFRHSLGYHLLRAGCDIRYIQDILGHKKIENTEVYTKVEKTDLRDVLDTYHPRRLRRTKHEKTEQKNTKTAIYRTHDVKGAETKNHINKTQVSEAFLQVLN